MGLTLFPQVTSPGLRACEAIEHSEAISQYSPDNSLPQRINKLATGVFIEIILPEIVREVNEGRHFGQARQILGSVTLASWLKNEIKENDDLRRRYGAFAIMPRRSVAL